MTRDEAVAIIQEQLGFRSDLSSNIVTNMKLAQTMLEQGPTKPWFLVAEDSYVDTETDEPRIGVPSDFLEEINEATLRYVPEDLTDGEVDLVKDEYDVLRKNYMDTDTGTVQTGAPEAYAMLGDYFFLFPVPDDEYRIHMIYYKRDTTLSTNVENGWLKHVPFLLIGKTGGMIASALRDPAAVGTFQRWEQEGRLLLASQSTARDIGNRSMQMGGPH